MHWFDVSFGTVNQPTLNGRHLLRMIPPQAEPHGNHTPAVATQPKRCMEDGSPKTLAVAFLSVARCPCLTYDPPQSPRTWRNPVTKQPPLHRVLRSQRNCDRRRTPIGWGDPLTSMIGGDPRALGDRTGSSRCYQALIRRGRAHDRGETELIYVAGRHVAGTNGQRRCCAPGLRRQHRWEQRAN